MGEPEQITYARYFQDTLGCRIVPLWGIEIGPSGAGMCRCPRRSSCEAEGKHSVGRWKDTPSKLPNSHQNWGYVSDNLVVIDLDSHDVEPPVEWGLTPTYEVGTRKGRHLIYSWDGPPLATRIGVVPHIDIKAHGGLVVGPGSRRVDGGFYTPLNGSMVSPLPEGVEGATHKVNTTVVYPARLMDHTHPLVWESSVEPAITDILNSKTRNSTLFLVLVQVFRRGWCGNDAVDAFKQAAMDAGLSAHEVETCAGSALKAAWEG